MSAQSMLSYWLSYEYTAFEGSPLSCILYGVYLVIAGMSLAMLHKKRYKLLFAYTVVQLVLTTLYLAISLYSTPAMMGLICGVVEIYSTYQSSPWPVISNTAFFLNTWVSNAFLLYRCYVICMGNKYALAVPALLYLSIVGTSIALLVVESSHYVINIHVFQVVGMYYWSLSAVINICASCIISVRLWMYRRMMCRVLGSQRGTFYLSHMAMTLESAFLYTTFAIIALVMFTLSNPLQQVFVPVFGMIQSISPSLIVYRIARGISFETDAYGSITVGSLRFASSVVQTGHQDTSDDSHAALCDSARKGGGDINYEV